jgi:dTDP-4-dehydrorhamnose 3,5-epimerase
MDGVFINSEKIITTNGGKVLHAVKVNDIGFSKFGEAYFSTIESKNIRAWKCHTKMTLNIVVPIGKIKFVLYDERRQSKTYGEFLEVIISRENYQRLTVPPMIWMGFQGVSKDTSILLNVASIVHDISEAMHKDISSINYIWN